MLTLCQLVINSLVKLYCILTYFYKTIIILAHLLPPVIVFYCIPFEPGDWSILVTYCRRLNMTFTLLKQLKWAFLVVSSICRF